MGTVTSNTRNHGQPVRNGNAASAPPASGKLSRKEILAAVASGKISEDDADKLLAEQESQGPARGITYRVSKKGAVSVYGLQQMPVTLYMEQWLRLSEEMPKIIEWIKANDGKTFAIDEKDDDGKLTGRKLNVQMKHKGQ